MPVSFTLVIEVLKILMSHVQPSQHCIQFCLIAVAPSSTTDSRLVPIDIMTRLVSAPLSTYLAQALTAFPSIGSVGVGWSTYFLTTQTLKIPESKSPNRLPSRRRVGSSSSTASIRVAVVDGASLRVAVLVRVLVLRRHASLRVAVVDGAFDSFDDDCGVCGDGGRQQEIGERGGSERFLDPFFIGGFLQLGS
ncbi:hypothetical protein LWI28_008611 [Acer negundo]|uniref:Uncharacterized protein n=1 Tax=Acer negundo TaxID=4023 RepID=A0AAD5IUD3_ACENE|nr:hypothetical protein LWI28_008611 [Acer negundo]